MNFDTRFMSTDINININNKPVDEFVNDEVEAIKRELAEKAYRVVSSKKSTLYSSIDGTVYIKEEKSEKSLSLRLKG